MPIYTSANCCAVAGRSPKTGLMHTCTIPKGVPHAEHEGWSSWGVWSGDKTGGGMYRPDRVEMRHIWKNDDYKPPKDKGIDYSTWVDEFDCLPDA
jgi:hypothetical protein